MRNADLTSVLAIKQPAPARLRTSIASFMEAYLTEEQSSLIKALTEEPWGYDK